MKIVSALILVCAFACASAQFGVKGGSSDSSGGSLSGSFYPRFNPMQGTKGRPASVNSFYGPSVYLNDGTYSTGRMIGQRDYYMPATRTVQPSNRFLYENRQPAQYVQYDAAPVMYNRPQVATVQRVPSFASYGSVGSVTGGNRQFTSSIDVSSLPPLSTVAASYRPGSSDYASVPAVSTGYTVPSIFSYPRASIVASAPSVSEKMFTDNRISSPGFSTIQSPGMRYGYSSVPSVSYPSVQTGYSVPSVSTGYSVPSVSTYTRPVTVTASAPAVSGNVFTDNRISSPGFSTIQSPVTTRYSVPTVSSYPSVSTGYSVPPVSTYTRPVTVTATAPAPAPALTVSGNLFTDNKISSPGFTISQPQDRVRFSTIPAVQTVQSVPSVSTGYNVPAVSSARLPTVTSFPAPSVVAASPSGQIFSDNKITSPGLTTIRSELPTISQQKQFADVVQTTEW